MKVLHVLNSKGIGGAEKYVLNLAIALKKLGVESEFAGNEGGWLYQQMISEGFVVHPLPMKGYFDVLSFYRLIRILKRGHFDLVHSNLMRASFYAKWAVKFSKTKLVMTAHSTNTHKRFSKRHPVIAVSDAVRSNLLKHGFRAECVHTILNGVPAIPSLSTEQKKELSRQLGVDDSKFIFLMVARVLKDKGHDLVIEAVSAMTSEERNQFQLLIVGPKESDWALNLQREAHLKELPISWIGQIDNPVVYYQIADALLLPSRREAISLSLLEGCSAKLGIIASNVGGIPEVIRHQENGLLIPAENSQRLSSAMKNFLDARDLVHELGQRAEDTFQQGFDVLTSAKKTLDVYQEALHES
jgi:glycosyltransferase involved in cell wall biosynthesis